jgi:hypothetical protein
LPVPTLRGYIEDSVQTLDRLPRLDGRKIQPGKTFDLENTSWSIGECFLHAANVASLLAPGRDMRARSYGLAGRRLASIWGTRFLTGVYICRQDEYAAETTDGVSQIEDNLPEIVRPLVAPLYERFSFFQLPSTLVSWRHNLSGLQSGTVGYSGTVRFQLGAYRQERYCFDPQPAPGHAAQFRQRPRNRRA